MPQDADNARMSQSTYIDVHMRLTVRELAAVFEIIRGGDDAEEDRARMLRLAGILDSSREKLADETPPPVPQQAG